MEYYDSDYLIKIDNNVELFEDDSIVDVFFRRSDHYCESSKTYWDNIQDEAIYLRVKEVDGTDKMVCLAKNLVKESEIYFKTDIEKEAFYEAKHSNDFYNHTEIYLTLSDKQAIQFLNIMSNNINDYDYNFQYCNQDKIIKNILKPNLDNEKVQKEYSVYLQESHNKKILDSMLENDTIKGDNVIKFPSGKK